MSPCAHLFEPEVSKAAEISPYTEIYALSFLRSQYLGLKNTWWQVLCIFLRCSYFIPLMSQPFLALACFILTESLKVWRYWFQHTAKSAISHLCTDDWLTWQVSSFCIKHIKIVLRAAVVFNRNIIQLTQVFFRRFFSFHLMPKLLCVWQAHISSQRLLFLSLLCCLHSVFYPEISSPGDESKRLSSAMYLASRDQSFIT